MGGQFAGDFRRAGAQDVRPPKMIFGRDDEMRGGEAAPDVGGGIDGQGTFGHQFAVEFSPNDGLTRNGLGVEHIAFFFDLEPALGLEIFGDGVGNLIVVQVHVTAAPFAHGGTGVGGDVQFGAAFEAGDTPEIQRAFGDFSRRLERLLNMEMPAALFAVGGKCSA